MNAKDKVKATIAAIAATGALVGAGIVLRPVDAPNPTPVPDNCVGELCQATIEVDDVSQCDALVRCDGCDESAASARKPGGMCPVYDDAGKRVRDENGEPVEAPCDVPADPCEAAATVPATHASARRLHCLRARGTIVAWHAEPVLAPDAGIVDCYVNVLGTRAQDEAWGETVDHGASARPPKRHLRDLPEAAKHNGRRAHTWAGMAGAFPDEQDGGP